MTQETVYKEGPFVRGVLRFTVTLISFASIAWGVDLWHNDGPKHSTLFSGMAFIAGGVALYALVVYIPFQLRRRRRNSNPVKCWTTIVEQRA
jgi:hypothetical protein